MSLDPPSPIEVLLVDDSAVVRHLVSDAIGSAPDIVVVGTAPNGLAGLERIATHVPDVVVLDVEMPVLDGLATLERIRAEWPDLPVIMFSTLTTRGATATLEALARGATDYVSKPSGVGDVEAARAAVVAGLLPVVRSCAAFGRVRRSRRAAPGHAPAATSLAPAATAPTAPVAGSRVAPPRPPAAPATHMATAALAGASTPRPGATAGLSAIRTRPRRAPLGGPRPRCEVLVIASSTGGPHALTEVITKLPGDLGIPVLVVQHMPALFTRLLAERLDARAALTVREASDGMAVEPGTVYVAPGGEHMKVRRAPGSGLVIARDDGPPENSCKPAADVLFRSAAATWGKGVVGLVLTGMGHDGLAGSRAVCEAGGSVYVQDEASSVVWGMPGAVAKEGLAEAELPLEEIAGVLTRELRRPVGAGAR